MVVISGQWSAQIHILGVITLDKGQVGIISHLGPHFERLIEVKLKEVDAAAMLKKSSTESHSVLFPYSI